MTPFEAYKLFMALKMHFTQPSYDYFKYNGKTNANQQSYNRRSDKFQFNKLAKHKDPEGFLVSNFTCGNNKWIGDLFNEQSEKNYTDWLKRNQSLTYNLTQEINRIDDLKQSILVGKDGQHPELMKLYRRDTISLETLCILNKLLSFFDYWDKRITDTVIWPQTRLLCNKYTPFIHYDKAKIKPVVKDALGINSVEA